MSRSAKIERPFAGEDRIFRLDLDALRDLQEKTDAGPGELLARLAPVFRAVRAGLGIDDIVGSGLLGTWRIDDIRAAILFGLIGGGLAHNDAMKLVKRWVDGRSPIESIPLAYEVLYAGVCGVEDEVAMGELQGGAEAARSPEASSASASAASTPKAPRSGSRRRKSAG